MQTVFEKIIEKLEEMIHPKQLYFCKYARGGCKHLDNDDKDCMECVVENAIEIVKQEAEQYNNGWISCSERLPEEYKLYDITFKNSAGIHSDSAIYNPYLKRWLWDADETELVENEILAWAEKREPYQPKGE